jgi:hypothetical protein
MRRDISRSIALQGFAPMDPACAGISTRGIGVMREALKRWEQKQGIERPKYGRGFSCSPKKTKLAEPPFEPKPTLKPEPKIKVPRNVVKKPRAPRPSRRKYDPAIPRSQRPSWIAYRKKYAAEHPPTDEERRVRAERGKAYRSKYSPERKAAELARIRAWKAARKRV